MNTRTFNQFTVAMLFVGAFNLLVATEVINPPWDKLLAGAALGLSAAGFVILFVTHAKDLR
jgi:ABC-type uncharacterized transport system permease subunit